MLTRQTFGAFDRDVWTIQWMLSQLDYDPGPIDGLWGQQTLGAILYFRQMNDLGPANDITLRGAADDAFRTALWGASFEAGLEVPVAPASGATSGGTSTRPVSIPTGQGTGGGVSPGVPKAGSLFAGLDLTMILAIGAVGIGAILLSRKGR